MLNKMKYHIKQGIWQTSQQALISFRHEKRFMGIFTQIENENPMAIESPCEALTLSRLVTATEKIEGDIAEVGVFRGGGAKIICEYNRKEKNLHLFDRFEEGLPSPTKDDETVLRKGDCAASMEGVKKYLSKYKNVGIYKGTFPHTSDPIINKKFSLVNIDVDLYEGTKDCIKFFYPRMSKGGIMVFHDYNGLNGVKKAVDEFFADKPEPIIPLYVCQAMTVKT